MNRRGLLLGAGLAGVAGLAGFQTFRRITMSKQHHSVEPWHMWGSSQTVIVPNVSDGTVFQQSTQLARVDYHRPETWRFLMGAELVQAPTPVVPNLLVIVQIQVVAGVGRSQLTIPATTNGQNTGFARFVWKFGATPIIPAQVKWTTRVRTPPLDEGLVSPFDEECDAFPAQSIQCNAQVVAVTSAGVVEPDPRTIVNVHAYFAPQVHVRPDWFKSAFAGELEGK